MSATLFQPEPSAKAPCTRTTFLMGCVMTVLRCSEDPIGSVDFRCRTPSRRTALVVLEPRSLQYPGSRTQYCCAAPAKLYEFDRIVRFGPEIAATDNAAAICRLFI